MSDQSTNPPAEKSAISPKTPDAPLVAPGTTIFQQSEHFRIVFSNFFKTRVGPGDYSVIFSVFADVPGKPSAIAVQEEVCVSMSWPQLKALSETLVLAIQAIEDQAGPIPRTTRGIPLNLDSLTKQALISYGFSKSP